MKLIDKYLLKTFLVPLGYCLATFIMLYIVYDLFDNLSDFIDAKTAVPDIVLFYLFLMPSVLIYIVPVSLLLSALYSLSQLTKNNELTAMRACGVSFYRLVLPYIAVGVLFSFAVQLVNETVGPWSAYWTNQFVVQQRQKGRVAVHVASNLAFKNEVARRIWLIDEFNTRSFEMKNVNLVQQRADGSDETKIQARQGYWLDGRWWFVEMVTQRYNRDGSPMGAPSFEMQREMADLTEVPANFINEIKDPEYLSSVELVGFLGTHQHLSREKIARVQVDLHSRIAMPWTCLVVMLLGIPFGAQTGRKGAFLGVVLALSLFFGFYTSINVALAIGKKQMIAPWLAGWLPNLFFFAIGLVLIYRMR